jgi:RimJ/RimL family protein N-acetyltransferase
MVIISDTLEIRSLDATSEELAAVLRVYQQCEDFLALGPVSQASLEMVQTDLHHSQQDGGVFCGVYDRTNGEMLGVVDFVLSGWQGDPVQSYISLLMIALPYRGKGIGACIVKAVEQHIRQGGRIQSIHAGVQVNNPQAIRFWQQMGYQIVSGPETQPDQTVAFRLLKHFS